MNLNDKQSKGTYCFSLFFDRKTARYFNFLGIEFIPQDVLNKIKGKPITHNKSRIQSDDSVIC